MNEQLTCKCGCEEYYTKEVGPHLGAYCLSCHKYIKWIKRPNKHLLTQVTVIHKLLEADNNEEVPW